MCLAQNVIYETSGDAEVVVELRPRLVNGTLLVSVDVGDSLGGSASYECLWKAFQEELPFP